MCYLSPRGSRSYGSPAGIGKQVQNPDRTSGFFYFIAEPVPVDRLLREEPRVLKAEGLQVKGQIPVMDCPLIRQIKEFPFSPAAFASVIVGIPLSPAFMGSGGIPDPGGPEGTFPIVPAFPPLKYL